MLAALLLPVFATPAAAQSNYETIAHRGLYHDVDADMGEAENSLGSVTRAYTLGMKGVELDLRLDADGRVIVTHDMVSNRAICLDNADGAMNPVDLALNLQAKRNPIWWNTVRKETLNNRQLKIYARNSRLVVNCNAKDPVASLQTLDSMLSSLKRFFPRIVESDRFMIILDVQDHRIFKLAAESIKRYGMQNDVFLKFFASKALASGYTYAGYSTCYQYAKNNSLLGLKIIPQINDGELSAFENDDRGIWAFGKTLPIPTYLSCWADAEKNHSDAPRMPIVSASVPADNPKATDGAFRAVLWTKLAGRKFMTIVPNPDAGRRISGQCRLFSFQSTGTSADSFNISARQAKTAFASHPSVKPDYIVFDVMGHRLASTWSTEYYYYTANLC